MFIQKEKAYSKKQFLQVYTNTNVMYMCLPCNNTLNIWGDCSKNFQSIFCKVQHVLFLTMQKVDYFGLDNNNMSNGGCVTIRIKSLILAILVMVLVSLSKTLTCTLYMSVSIIPEEYNPRVAQGFFTQWVTPAQFHTVSAKTRPRCMYSPVICMHASHVRSL